jgi:hypothetical protein
MTIYRVGRAGKFAGEFYSMYVDAAIMPQSDIGRICPLVCCTYQIEVLAPGILKLEHPRGIRFGSYDTC